MPVGEHSTSLLSHMTNFGNVRNVLQSGEEMNCRSRSFIMPDDVTSMDIICGTNAIAYNHPGNKRFRFLISFNLDRYRIAKGRKQKSKVINSIVDQLIYAGCRFVKKDEMSDHCKDNDSVMNGKDSDTERWEVMSPKEGRVKVAHALRDKRQSHDHAAALARLEIRIKVHDDTSDMLKDSHYIAANAMILTVELSGNESETLIKALLCDAIDSVGVPTDAEYGHQHEHEHDLYSSMDSSNEGIATEIHHPTKETIMNSHGGISSTVSLEDGIKNEYKKSTTTTEGLPPTVPLPIIPPLSPVKSYDRNHILEESSQQWIPNHFLSPNALVLEHLLMNKWYQM